MAASRQSRPAAARYRHDAGAAEASTSSPIDVASANTSTAEAKKASATVTVTASFWPSLLVDPCTKGPKVPPKDTPQGLKTWENPAAKARPSARAGSSVMERPPRL